MWQPLYTPSACGKYIVHKLTKVVQEVVYLQHMGNNSLVQNLQHPVHLHHHPLQKAYAINQHLMQTKSQSQ
jgi:hypothetical protein